MNKVFINIILVLILFISVTRPQDMIAPESVAYDPVQKRYFISNFGNGNILEIDSLGNKQYFKTGLVKSIGMVIQYNVL